MPKGKRREICLETGKKPTHPRKRKNWKESKIMWVDKNP